MSLSADHQPFEKPGLRVLTLTIPKAGMRSQCEGLARHFCDRPDFRSAAPKSFFARIWAAYKPQRILSPDLVISHGWRAEVEIRRLCKALCRPPLTVHLQRAKAAEFDMVFVSSHLWSADLDGSPVHHRMIGVPHTVTKELLDDLRPVARARFAPNDERIAAIFIGGPNGAYDYDAKALSGLIETLNTLLAEGWKLLVSCSPRSTRETLDAVLALRGDRMVVWDGSGDNPYLAYLAAADAFLITMDSITMPCEALTSGRPVYIQDLTRIPGDKSAKFDRFHEEFQGNLGLTRLFNGAIEPYAYTPLNETARLAEIVRVELRKRNSFASE